MGLSYDPSGAGYVLTDNLNNRYTYDAEGRVATVALGIGRTETYGYDGDGNRVLKSGGGNSGSTYWYGAEGTVTDEQTVNLNPNGSPGYIIRNLYFNGHLAMRMGFTESVYPSVFVFDDQVGSSSATVGLINGTGAPLNGYLVTNTPFFPFGGYVTPPATNLEQQFTGKERDAESGNDYFGARYYNSSLGRFLSPDFGLDQHPENPQTWNLYNYVHNNPLSLVDPTGEYVCGSGVTQSMCDQFQKSLDSAQQAADKLKDEYGAKSNQYTEAQRSIDSWGKENVDNGVTVQAGNTGSYGGSTGVSNDSNSPTGSRITVTFGKSDFDGSAYSGIGAAHEGSHVADAQAWIASGFNPALNPTSYNTEFRAYLVTAHLAEGAFDLGMIGPNFSGTYGNHRYVIWQAGAMPSQTDRRIDTLIRGAYNVNPESKVRSWQMNTRGGGSQ